MLNCSSVIDWQYCNIEWGDGGTVLFDYESSKSSCIKEFYMRIMPILDLEEDESFFY